MPGPGATGIGPFIAKFGDSASPTRRRTTMADRPVTLQQAAEELGVHYMTVYRYVRTGRLPATRVGGTWQIDPADLGQVRLTRASKSDGGGAARRRSTTRLQGRLLAGDEAGAW